jgi:hypothetical protein
MPASDSAPAVTEKHYARKVDVAVAQWSAPAPERDLERDEEGLPIWTPAQLRADAAHEELAEEGRQRAHIAMYRMQLAQRKAQAHAAKVNACQQPVGQRAARRARGAVRCSRQIGAELRHRSGRPAPATVKLRRQRQLILIAQRHMAQAERLQLLHAPNRAEAYTPVHPCQVGVMGSVQAQNAPPGAALQINKEHRLIP